MGLIDPWGGCWSSIVSEPPLPPHLRRQYQPSSDHHQEPPDRLEEPGHEASVRVDRGEEGTLGVARDVRA